MIRALTLALLLAACADGPTLAPDGPVVAPPPQYEEMCRERPNPILCPEV